ncbi:MAG: VOC family protein [Aquabacterium sp.]|nr:VOC family protein [Aquabacterium sp.]
MPEYLRLRQICLAAPRLEPVLDDLQAIFGIEVCHRDPGLSAYGLQNALLPIGTDFLEVVAPLHDDTAAGRFIHRTRGHGGYMAIFQVPDPRQRQAHAAALGVRTAHEIDRPDYQSAQLHPRDCRAAFIELGHSPGGDERSGTWWPAGPHWHDHVRTDDTRRLLGIELESPEPEALATHWSRILATPLTVVDGAPALVVDGVGLRFVPGAADCLGAVVVEVADVRATLDRAVACGHRIEGDAFHLAGVTFRVR